MRRSASAIPVFLLLALPCLAVESEFRGPAKPEAPIIKPVETPGLPSAGQPAPIPQLGLDAAVPEAPLAAQLGLKNDAPLAPALAPVPEQLSAPSPGQDASAGKISADEDWQARTGERPLNIVLAAAEAVPLIKTGGLADVIDAVGRGFAARGHNVSLFLPRHAQVKTGGLHFRQRLATLDVPVAGRTEKAILWEAKHQGMRVFLIENDGFFKRDAPYGGAYGDFHDSDERFIFFSRAVLEAAKALDLHPDIVHAHDWHAALTAPMLKLLYNDDAALGATKAVVTIHNMAFQGSFEPKASEKAGFSPEHFTADALEHQGRFNFLKGGIRYADAVTTVSPTYAKQIANDPEFGMGLETVIKGRGADMHGVINGVDHELWNPETDGLLSRHYGPEDVELGKAANKKALQGGTGLTLDPKAPLFGVAARLAHQKGLDLVADIAPRLVELGGQLVIVGSGETALEDRFKELAVRYPKNIFLHPFDDLFPRRIFAAADFLFMPSRFEPCGLSQLMAQRYGTLPIVTKTGGLADTVTDVRDDPSKGDGLFVNALTPEALTEAVVAAIAHFNDPQALAVSRRTAMTKDSSWDASVERYLSLFRSLTDAPTIETPAKKAPAWRRALGWLRNLSRAMDARSKAERYFWYSVFLGLSAAVAAPVLWGSVSLVFPLFSVWLGALPFAALSGITISRMVRFVRHKGLFYGPFPLGRWKRAALIGLTLGAALGAAPLIFRVPLTEKVLPMIVQEQTAIRHIPGNAMQDELVKRMSANPVGRQVLDGLRDRAGIVRLPPFYLSKQKDSMAAHIALVDGLFIDLPSIKGHGWTVEEFLRDPEKQRVIVGELDVTLVHELTHGAQARRLPADLKELGDMFRLHLNFQTEDEAYMTEHFYTFEQLKADPHAKVSSDAFGNFLGPIDDLEKFLDGLAGGYPHNKNIDTVYYREYFAGLRAGWPAHAMECDLILARRALPKMPKVAAMYLERARAIAEKNGLPAPRLEISGAPLTAPGAK